MQVIRQWPAVIIMVVVLTGLSAAPVLFAQTHTRAQWIAKFEDLDAAYSAIGWSTDPDSGVLAWGESHLLRAYLDMYEATSDAKYLDTFVVHVNNMIANLDDPDDDGYLGWCSPFYSANLVQNGDAEMLDPDGPDTTTICDDDFESPSLGDPTLPDGWVRWQSTSATAFLDPNSACNGNYGVTVKNNPAYGWQLIYLPITYETGATYWVSVSGRVSGASVSPTACARMRIYDKTTGATLGGKIFYNLDWSNQSFFFTAPDVAGHNLWLTIWSTVYQAPDLSVHCDMARIYRMDYAILPIWEYAGATTATAYRDLANKTAGLAGITLHANPAAGPQVLQAPLNNPAVLDNQNYEPGIQYQVNFKAKTSGAAGGMLDIYDFTSGQVVYSQSINSPDYEPYTGTFVAPSAPGHDLKIRLRHLNPALEGVVYFDEISVRRYAEYVVHDGMIAVPLARFVKMIARGEAPAAYAAHAGAYLELLEDHLIPKWNACWRDVDDYASVYVAPDDGSLPVASGVSLPHNQYAVMASAFAFLGQALGGAPGATYLAAAARLGYAFKSKLRLNPGDIYEWNYWDNMLPGETVTTSIEDTSHSNLEMESAINIYRTSIPSFDLADMMCFKNTFLCAMWDGNTNTPNIGDRVSTSLGTKCKYKTWAWLRLGAYDRQVYDLIRLMYDLRWDDLGGMSPPVVAGIIQGVPVVEEFFEIPSSGDATLPDGWIRWQSTPDTAYLDANAAVDGNYGVTVKNNPAYGWQLIYLPIAYEPGVLYRVTFFGRVSGASASPSVGGRVQLLNQTTGATLGLKGFYNQAWSNQAFSFTAPDVAGHNLWLRIRSSVYQAPDLCVHCDNLEMRAIE